MRVLRYNAPGFSRRLDSYCKNSLGTPEFREEVARILQAVEQRGDDAVVQFTAKFDHVRLEPGRFRVDPEEIRNAGKSLTKAQSRAIKIAIHCVEDFHRRSLPVSWKGKNPHGATVGEQYHPLQRIGIYVPGGNVPLVSTVVMTAALARLAKVPEIAVFTPPGRDGSISPGLLAALHYCHITEVYRIGGIQAIGAMAFGTATVPPVNKIFGPGNAFVTEAKRQVFGITGVDLLPGPSEVMIVADQSADPALLGADILAQAEHGAGGRLFLATTKEETIRETEQEIKRQLTDLSRASSIRPVLKNGFLAVLVDNLDQAVDLVDTIAPEHLELHIEKRLLNGFAKKVRHAGAIFLGSHSPVVLGDFTAGPSHTLPTGRTGRFFSGLSVTDFFRRNSLIQYNPRSLALARPVVEAFSQLERLDAHGRSLQIRFEK